jgi:hypothetical protein
VRFDREIMGAIGLAIVWVNTGLIVAHGARELAGLRALLVRLVPLRPGVFGIAQGTFEAVPGRTGPTYRLTQTAHRGRDGKIYFHDHRAESVFESGTVVTDTGTLSVEAGAEVWVWPDRNLLALRQKPDDLEEFEEFLESARRASGATRKIELSIKQGDTIYVAGTLSPEGTHLEGSLEAPLLISATDPRRWLRHTVWRNVAMVAAALALGMALTALCFWPPVFGLVSQLGAFGLFIYFLLVQPFGLSLTRRNYLPHQAEVHGIWTKPKQPQGALISRTVKAR